MKKNKFNIGEEVVYDNNLYKVRFINICDDDEDNIDIEYQIENIESSECWTVLERDLQVSPNATNVYYKGDPDRWQEIKADLERRAKIQNVNSNLNCNSKDSIYYLNKYGEIVNVFNNGTFGSIIKSNYHKLILPDKPKLPIDFDAYTGFSSRIPNLGKLVILAYLMELRDIYNDGWKPDWSSASCTKCVIYNASNELRTDVFNGNISSVFAFKSIKLRDKFYKAFKSQLEEVKELI